MTPHTATYERDSHISAIISHAFLAEKRTTLSVSISLVIVSGSERDGNILKAVFRSGHE